MRSTNNPHRVGLLWGGLTLATVLLASDMVAATGAGEIPSAFFIAKSSNKNQVHYAVRVDNTSCAPFGLAPVRAYWRMLEQSADATEPLLDREQRAYGIERQEVLDGGAVRLVLRALPQRPIMIRSSRGEDGICRSTATLTLAGANARLHNIYVQQSLFGVAYLLVTGWADSGAVVRERIEM